MGRAKDDFGRDKLSRFLQLFFLPPARPHLPVWCGAGAPPAAASAPQLDQVSFQRGTCNADSTTGHMTADHGNIQLPVKLGLGMPFGQYKGRIEGDHVSSQPGTCNADSTAGRLLDIHFPGKSTIGCKMEKGLLYFWIPTNSTDAITHSSILENTAIDNK